LEFCSLKKLKLILRQRPYIEFHRTIFNNEGMMRFENESNQTMDSNDRLLFAYDLFQHIG